MKNAKFFLFLAAFMVAILAACSSKEPTGEQSPNNPGQNPNPNQGCEPNCPPPEIKTSILALVSNPGGHVLVDGRDTGLMAIVNVPVMVTAEVGRRDVCVARDSARPEETRVMCILDAEFNERTVGQRITDADGYRDYNGNWGRRGTRETVVQWDTGWTSNDPRIPGTSVSVIDHDSQTVLWGVYPNNLLGVCADPTDIQAALNEGRAPRVVTDPNTGLVIPECNLGMDWGQTIENASGLKGEEIFFRRQDFRRPDRPITEVVWERGL